MTPKTENCHVHAVDPLVSPEEVKGLFPLSDAGAERVLQTRHAIRDILEGRDARRLVIIVGPCSIHDAQAAYEYAERLKPVADAVQRELVVVMRTYFEKPRTTVGWKGLINDPDLDGSCDIARGLPLARQILLRIAEMGVACSVEMLDPVTPQYLADLVSWAAIGTRTIESQTHREMASGLSMPVGFKNGTDGRLDIALNAIVSASQPHRFLGINRHGQTAMISTTGNPDRHLVLRGGKGPNYSAADVAEAATAMQRQGIERGVMVDCSHGNSNKDYRRQAAVYRDVVGQFAAGQQAIMGLMLESNLHPGNQSWKQGVPLAYGVSITDACIGWDETEELLRESAELLARTHE